MEPSKNLYFKAVKRISNRLKTKLKTIKTSRKKIFNIEEVNNPHKTLSKNRNHSLEGKNPSNKAPSLSPNKHSSQIDLKCTKMWEPDKLPYPPGFVLRYFSSSLSVFEQEEILGYDSIYYIASSIKKIEACGDLPNNGFDDEINDYLLMKHDHIAYRYEILEFLGRGTYGQVIKAFDHKDKSMTAIKVIKNEHLFHRQARIEIKILQKLNQYEVICENLITVLANFTFRGHICIVFELLSMNLYEFQKSHGFKPFPNQLLKDFSEQILTGMRFFHNLGVLHCDLKPQNIMLGNSLGIFKIIDFGSGCFSNRRVFTYIQSMFYRAPEVIFGLGYDELIDVWSFGCILVELVIGKPVFVGDDEMEMVGSMVEVLGLPPWYMIENSGKKIKIKEYLKKHFSGKEQKNIAKRPLKDLIENPKLLDLISSKNYLECLCWDPTERLTAESAQTHEYLQKELKHRFSLPILKLEKLSTTLKSSQITPRKPFQISEPFKKTLFPSPKKRLTQDSQHLSKYFLN